LDATHPDAPNTPTPADAQAAVERALRQAALDGRVAQPAKPKTASHDARTWISAQVLRELASESDPSLKVHERSVRLKHLRVVGFLDLEDCEVRRPLRFEDCVAPAYPDFNAWAYAAQMLLSAIELRQSTDWAPVQCAQPVKAASGASAVSVPSVAAVAGIDAEPLPPVSGWGRGALYWS